MKSAFALLLVCGTLSFAAPLINEPVAELRLVSGKVLHDAQAKGFLARSVLVKHREGAETVAYDDFPAPYRDELARRRPAPSATVAAVSVAPKPAAAAVPAVKAKVESPSIAEPKTKNKVSVTPAVSLSTSRIGSSCTAVELHNGADAPTEIHCTAIQATTSTGKVLNGRQWVASEVTDMVSHSLGTKQVIPSHTSTTLYVAFDPLPAGVSITQVSLKSAE